MREYLLDLQSKARTGDPDSVFALASEYSTGGGMLRADPVKAAKWMKKGAEMGHAVSQMLFASMCATGTGVPKDDVAAARWMHAGAEQGSSNAALALAE